MANIPETVAEKSATEEVASPQQETSNDVSSQDTQKVSPEPVEDKSKEFNFRKLRETNERLEEELRIAKEQEATSKEEELGNDDLVEGKHLKKGLLEIKSMIRQKELEKVPDKLNGRFKDFDQVVTKENLEKLKDTEPELFFSIQTGNAENLDANTLYAKGVAAYKMLKSLGNSPGEENYRQEKQDAQSNHQKPLSTNAIKGSGALHEANIFANGLTPELKKQLQKEMVAAAKAR